MPRVMPAGRWPSLQRAFCCHSSFQTCSTAPCPTSFHSLSAQQICHREKSPPTQASFRWVGEEIGQQLRKTHKLTSLSLPHRAEGFVFGWLCGSFFARTFESDSLSREPKGQKTSCPPNHGLVSLQGFTFICKVILLPYPPMETKKSQFDFSKAHIHSLCLSGYKE